MASERAMSAKVLREEERGGGDEGSAMLDAQRHQGPEEEEEEDVPETKKQYCYLDVFRRRRVFRACFESIFTNLTLRDLCRLQPACKWMAEEKRKILELHKANPPSQEEAARQQKPLAELKREYRKVGNYLDVACHFNDVDKVDRICTRWYGNKKVLDSYHGWGSVSVNYVKVI